MSRSLLSLQIAYQKLNDADGSGQVPISQLSAVGNALDTQTMIAVYDSLALLLFFRRAAVRSSQQ